MNSEIKGWGLFHLNMEICWGGGAFNLNREIRGGGYVI